MSDSWESFYLGGAKVGVILRSRHPAGVGTLSCFAVDERSHFHVESTIRFAGQVSDWTSYRYIDHGAGKTVLVKRAELPLGQREAVPSYGEYLLVPDVAAGATRLYARLRDGAPDQPRQDARLECVGPTEVIRPAGEPIECIQVDLCVDGSRLNRFWVADGALIKSDWNGAESFAEPTLEAALEGTDDYVRAAVERRVRW